MAAQAAQIAQLQKQGSPVPVAPVTGPTAAPATPAPAVTTPPTAAPADTPIHFSVTAPASPVPTVLAALSKQVGVPILSDDTVAGTVGVMTVDQPGLEPTLDQVTKIVPGLTWQKVYLPQNAPLPKGEALSQQVRDLKALAATPLTLPDSATKSLVSLSQQKLDAATPAPDGMQTVYLVTNETVRAQRLAAQKAAGQNAATGQGAVGQAVSGLQSASDMLGQMTPDEQRQALPLMFQQFGQMIKNIDPTVRQQLFQQFRQFGP